MARMVVTPVQVTAPDPYAERSRQAEALLPYVMGCWIDPKGQRTKLTVDSRDVLKLENT